MKNDKINTFKILIENWENLGTLNSMELSRTD